MTQDFESTFELMKRAQEMPLTAARIDGYITFICGFIDEKNKVIKYKTEKGQDTEYDMYHRDRAMHVLGLSGKPTPPWRKDEII